MEGLVLLNAVDDRQARIDELLRILSEDGCVIPLSLLRKLLELYIRHEIVGQRSRYRHQNLFEVVCRKLRYLKFLSDLYRQNRGPVTRTIGEAAWCQALLWLAVKESKEGKLSRSSIVKLLNNCYDQMRHSYKVENYWESMGEDYPALDFQGLPYDDSIDPRWDYVHVQYANGDVKVKIEGDDVHWLSDLSESNGKVTLSSFCKDMRVIHPMAKTFYGAGIGADEDAGEDMDMEMDAASVKKSTLDMSHLTDVVGSMPISHGDEDRMDMS